MAYPTVLTLAERTAPGVARPDLDDSGAASRGQNVMECSPTPKASSERSGERLQDFPYQFFF